MVKAATLLAAALATASVSLISVPAFADDTFTVAPMPPGDTRSKFVPPSGAVFVVDQKTGAIALCFPDTDKDNNYVVTCTPSVNLPLASGSGSGQ